jgi:hypothetical protein
VRKIQYLLLRFFQRLALRTDRFLLRLSKLLSTPTGTDILLCTVGYTLELVQALGSHLLERRLSAIAADIAEKANDVLFPGEALIAELPAPASTKLLAHAVGSSKALGEVISDFRIFVRLWGLMGIYTWTRGVLTEPLPRDASPQQRLLRSITWLQIVSGWTFQILENGAYLSSKGVLTATSWSGSAGKARETQWWVWSSRFWAAHVGLEFVRLYALWLYQNQGTSDGEKEKLGDGEKEGKLLAAEKKKEDWLWWRDLVSNVAYFPMTLHWSVEEGLLSGAGVGICGMIAGGSLLVDAWKQTA